MRYFSTAVILFAFFSSIYADEPTSQEIVIEVKINCPMSEEFMAFMKSIPQEWNPSMTLEEWKKSFIYNFTELFHLIESGKIYSSSWTVNTNEKPLDSKGQLSYKTLTTSQGVVSYLDTEGTGFPVVLIHGNSCSSKIFNKQIAAFKGRYRMISVDLPGHGMSNIPINPETAYTIPGYASVLDEVVQTLGLDAFAVIGFSMGGNIALQWSQMTDAIKGIMLVSSAPIKYSEEVLDAYPPNEDSFVAWPDQLTEAQAKQFMGAGGFQVEDPSVYFVIEDAMKTDGKARANMVASILAGKGIHETEIVSQLSFPLAVVVGNQDSALNLDYIARLNYRNLWQRKVQFMTNAQHAIPLHQSDPLNLLLAQFLKDIQD